MNLMFALLLSLIAVLLAAPAVPAQSQQPERVYRIGTLFPPIVHKSFRIEEFQRGLRDHGYLEGRSFILDSQLTDDERFYRPDLATELVRAKVDVIVTIEIAGGQAASQATTTIPIVVLNCDPHQELVTSLARPGGNVTGQSCMNAELTPKKLEVFKAAVPGLSRVAFLHNPKQPGPTLGLKLAREAARSLRITIHPIEVRDTADFDQAFGMIATGRFDGLFVYHDFVTASQRHRIVEFAALAKLPAIYGYREWVSAGGLISYGPNLGAMYSRAGRQVAKILSGTRPADLPIEQPTTFELIVNRKTARALGLTIPPSVLLQADQAIE